MQYSGSLWRTCIYLACESVSLHVRKSIMFVKLRVSHSVAAQPQLLHIWASKRQQAVCNTSFEALDACQSSVYRLSL